MGKQFLQAMANFFITFGILEEFFIIFWLSC